MPQVDHLLYGVPELDFGIAHLEALLGVRAEPGGRHPDLGTHNALLGLGDGRYLELIAADPRAAEPRPVPPFGLGHLAAPRLVTWVARDRDLEKAIARARACGVELGAPQSGSRRRPDGGTLTWRMAGVHAPRMEGVIPFLIDWGETPHPAASAVPECTLLELRAEHPDASRARAVLQALGLEVPVTHAASAGLVATLRTPRGTVELR